MTYLDPSSSQIGHKESAADTAQVLCRMYDAIEFRGSAQATVQELADFSSVPVYNGLTDEWHPTQMLADYLTMLEHSPKPVEEIAYAYLGDARSNMGNSLLVMGAIMGSDVRICGPQQLWPDAEVQAAAHARAAESGARIMLTEDPDEALPGADFVETDVWVSMGEPADVWTERVRLLTPYQVNSAALAKTGNPDVRFLHCLPAFHDTGTVVGKDIAKKTGMTGGARGHRRGLPLRRERRVRRGREPPAHDQGDHGRDDRLVAARGAADVAGELGGVPHAERVAGRVQEHPDVRLRLVGCENRPEPESPFHLGVEPVDLDVEVRHHALLVGHARPHGRDVSVVGLEGQTRTAARGPQDHPPVGLMPHLPAEELAIEVSEEARIGCIENDTRHHWPIARNGGHADLQSPAPREITALSACHRTRYAATVEE